MFNVIVTALGWLHSFVIEKIDHRLCQHCALPYRMQIICYCRPTMKSAGVRQDCMLSSTLFNIFLERIMAETLEDHTALLVRGGQITNLWSPDDVARMAKIEQEWELMSDSTSNICKVWDENKERENRADDKHQVR